MNGRNLKEIEPGQKAKVIKITGSGSIRRRIMDMAFCYSPGLTGIN